MARQREQESDARQKAEQAERTAAASADPAETDKQRQVANVWREVADTLRQENESLKAQLSKVMREAEEVKSRLSDPVQLRTEGSEPAIVFGGEPLLLPQPTQPPRTAKCPSCGADVSLLFP